MGINLKSIAAVACAAVISAYAEGPSVGFSGYLDADAVADFKGRYYANTELDLGLTSTFTDKVSAHVYATVNNVYASSGGSIPAGTGKPQERWLNVVFDGYDLTYASKIGTFTVGDLVYQYGKFNYYYYKRLSMITSENFSRGVKYGIGNDKVSTELQVGVADIDSYTGDIQGTTKVGLGESGSVAAFYGVRGSSWQSFKTGSNLFLGAEYNGAFGDAFKVKFDLGYQSVKAATDSADRSNVFSLLLEPSLALGKFSLAATGFLMIDRDSVSSIASYTPVNSKVYDEAFVYVEPGVTINDYLAVGLPLEFHGRDIDIEKDEEFWAVPTFYVYPTKNVQWWIWGQVVAFTADNKDPAFYAGSEIIVTF